jgi:hypothetical protein
MACRPFPVPRVLAYCPRQREEAVQGNDVASAALLCPGCPKRFVWARDFRKRFVLGNRSHRAQAETDLLDGGGVISNSSPEASAGGRLFDLSAHEPPPESLCRAVGGWLRGIVRGLGTVPSPEPPLSGLPLPRQADAGKQNAIAVPGIANVQVQGCAVCRCVP